MKSEQELLQAVLEARQKVAEIDASLTEAKDEKEKAEAILIEYMDGRELKSFKSATLNCTAIRKETLYVSIEKDKKEEALRWIEEECGRGDLIKPAIHNKTLTSFISERLKNAEPILKDVFQYYFKPELAIVQAKKEG